MGICQGPCMEAFQADASKWHLGGFTGGPWRDAEVPAKFGESGNMHRAMVSPGWAGCRLPANLSFRQEESQTSREVSVSSWHWSCGLPRARGWRCQGREQEGGINFPYSKSSLEETGRECLLSQWMGKLRPGAEKSFVQGHFIGKANGTVEWTLVWP